MDVLERIERGESNLSLLKNNGKDGYDLEGEDELLRLAKKGKKFEKLYESNCPWELCTEQPADEDTCNDRCPFGDMCDGFELEEVKPAEGER